MRLKEKESEEVQERKTLPHAVHGERNLEVWRAEPKRRRKKKRGPWSGPEGVVKKGPSAKSKVVGPEDPSNQKGDYLGSKMRSPKEGRGGSCSQEGGSLNFRGGLSGKVYMRKKP